MEVDASNIARPDGITHRSRRWQTIKIKWSEQKQAQRQARGVARKLACLEAKAKLEVQQVNATQVETTSAALVGTVVEPVELMSVNVARAKEGYKPAPNHPWRKMARGRAKYQINPNFVHAKFDAHPSCNFRLTWLFKFCYNQAS